MSAGAKPNFCEGCERYHPRDYADCVRRQPAAADSVDWDEYNSAGLHAGQCGPHTCGRAA